MRGARIVLVLIVLGLLAAVAYLLLSPAGLDLLRGSTTVTSEEEIVKMTAGFVALPYRDDYGMTRLSGYIDNLTDKELAEVQLEMQLIDKDGNKAEVVRYTLKDIPPKSRKTFDANAGAIGGSRTAEIKVTSVKVVD
jgi:hypothetical protein